MLIITKPANHEITETLNFSCNYCSCEYSADNQTFFSSLEYRKKVDKGEAKNLVFAKCPFCGGENGSEIK